MAYEFDEIQFVKVEGSDWWQTLKKFPKKVLDQDFGKEVQITDLVESFTEPASLEQLSSLSQKEKPKIYDLDNLKLKEDVIRSSGYSMVNFKTDSFEAVIFSRQFGKHDFLARIEKGFLIISATQKAKVEGDGTLWRHFERRYMLPHDCHITDVKRQLTVEVFDGGICAKVRKAPLSSPRRRSKSPRKENME